MYSFFRKHLGEKMGVAVTGFVYGVMILMILVAASYPHIELKYTTL